MFKGIIEDKNTQIRKKENLTAEYVFKIAKCLNDEEYYSLISLILKHDESSSKDIIFHLLKWNDK